jgi:hypothetical protein
MDCSHNIDGPAFFNDNTHDARAAVYGLHSALTSAGH